MTTVFFDVDTQLDFLYPAGSLYVPGAEAVVPSLAQLNRFAAAHGRMVISTTDAHLEDDPEFKSWPAHCVAGTLGQHKPATTVLEKRVVVPDQPGAVILDGAQQIILEKRSLDCFLALHLPEILRKTGADRYVVYGVVTEVCVRFAAMGLLETGARVELVTDAVRHLSETDRDTFFHEFAARGGVLTTLSQIVGA